MWLLVIVPLVAIGLPMYLSSNWTAAQPASKPVALTPSEEAAKLIPDLSHIPLETSKKVEAVDAHLVHELKIVALDRGGFACMLGGTSGSEPVRGGRPMARYGRAGQSCRLAWTGAARHR